MKPKAVIWDWNGTLLDDVALCCDLLNTLLERHGYDKVNGISAYKEVFGFPIEEYYKRAGFDFTKQPYSELAAEYMTLYKSRCDACSLGVGALSTLQGLQAQGVKQIILSASPCELLYYQLDRYAIRSYFTEVLGLDNIYAADKAGLGKSFIEKCELSRNDIIMVGDSVHDLHTAQQMGVQCILYAGGHEPKARLLATGNKVIDTLEELIGLYSSS